MHLMRGPREHIDELVAVPNQDVSLFSSSHSELPAGEAQGVYCRWHSLHQPTSASPTNTQWPNTQATSHTCALMHHAPE